MLRLIRDRAERPDRRRWTVNRRQLRALHRQLRERRANCVATVAAAATSPLIGPRNELGSLKQVVSWT
jgi:hypothetical protein